MFSLLFPTISTCPWGRVFKSGIAENPVLCLLDLTLWHSAVKTCLEKLNLFNYNSRSVRQLALRVSVLRLTK